MSGCVGLKIDRWCQPVYSWRFNRLLAYIEHRTVRELHATKGWRFIGHTKQRVAKPVPTESRFIRTNGKPRSSFRLKGIRP